MGEEGGGKMSYIVNYYIECDDAKGQSMADLEFLLHINGYACLDATAHDPYTRDGVEHFPTLESIEAGLEAK